MKAELITVIAKPVAVPPPSYKLIIEFDNKVQARLLASFAANGMYEGAFEKIVATSCDHVSNATRQDYRLVLDALNQALSSVRHV